MKHTIQLDHEQSAAWDQGGWLSLEIQETILEDIERKRLRGTVTVLSAEERVLFAVCAERGVL